MSELPSPPDWNLLRSGSRKARLLTLRDAVAPLLAINFNVHFTDHSVAHSDAITHIVDQLLVVLDKNRLLNDDEAFVLYATCYLHDLGMHFQAAQNTKALAKLNLADAWEGLPDEKKRAILRDNHAEISAELVAMSVESSHPPIGLQLRQSDRPDDIAALCEAHTLDTENERYRSLVRPVADRRLDLLSSVFRIADILDETRRRVDETRREALNLSLESSVHWYRHYYTEDIKIDSEKREIVLWFVFPSSKREQYKTIVPDLQIPWIVGELNRHQKTLNQCGVAYFHRTEIPERIYSTTQEMPSNVFAEMKRIVTERAKFADSVNESKRLLEESEDRRNALFELAVIERNENGSPDALVVSQIHAKCMNLWEQGGRQSALVTLRDAFQSKRTAIEPTLRLKIGIDLGQMMLAYGDARQAAYCLLELEGLIDQEGVPLQLKYALMKVLGLSLVHAGDLPNGTSKLRWALDNAATPEERAGISALILETQLLSGDLAGVIS